MAEYLGTVYLGGLYNNGTVLPRPTKPWRKDELSERVDSPGNVPEMSGSMANYTIGNTPSSEAYKLKWVMIKDGGKTLYICDRNILTTISWDDLDSQGYVFGKDIVIDNRKFKCRLMIGGTNYRNSGIGYMAATPVNNEWDRFIYGEERIPGLPVPVSTDSDRYYNRYDLESSHNKFWNWASINTFCQDVYRNYIDEYRTVRGSTACSNFNGSSKSDRRNWNGWRPVLEAVNSSPTISGTNTNLGAKNTNFNITYSVNDVDTSDTLTVTEKLDNGTIRTISSAVRNQTYTINITPANLALGSHTVTITVNDGKGGTAQRTYTFQRTNSAPVINGADTNLGQMTVAFSRSYTITDADGDRITVTEKLDTEIIRTYTALLGTTQSISVSQDRWIRLKNGNHTLKVEATDGKASTVIRTFSFSKNERIIEVELSTPFEADARPRKILVTPSWQIEGATARVEVCNNAFDSAPTWEDMTPQVIINRVFNFINQTKTAEKWGINIRITITKNEGYTGEVSISSIGGAFE